MFDLDLRGAGLGGLPEQIEEIGAHTIDDLWTAKYRFGQQEQAKS